MILNEVRWGIIGCGNVTEVKSGPPLQMVEHSSLVAVMRRTPGMAQDYAKRHDVPKWYEDADLLINDPDVNAVYVATHPNTHLEYAVKAMRAGKPAYVEKPMARNYAECLEMIKVSEQTKMPLFAAYYRRCLPGFVKVKELIESGSIGTVRLVNVRYYYSSDHFFSNSSSLPWRLNPEISGGGIFFDLASHTLDYLDYIFGPIEKIKANALNQAGQYKPEDTVLANWQHQSGVAGVGTWCFCTSEKNSMDEIEIIGSEGRIVFSTFGFVPIILESKRKNQKFKFPKPPHVQLYLMETIVASLRGTGQSPSTGYTAARTSWVMDEIVKGYYNKM